MRFLSILFLFSLVSFQAGAQSSSLVGELTSGQFITIGGVYESPDTVVQYSDQSGKSKNKLLAFDVHYVVEQLCKPESVQVYGKRNEIKCFVK